MKKIHWISIFVIIASVLVAGCSGASSDDTPKTKTPPKLKSDVHSKGSTNAPGGNKPSSAL